MTLLDVGATTRIGECPYAFNKSTNKEEWKENEYRRVMRHSHLAPEVFHGRQSAPSSDAYSLGVLLRDVVQKIWMKPSEEMTTIIERSQGKRKLRPTIKEFMEALSPYKDATLD